MRSTRLAAVLLGAVVAVPACMCGPDGTGADGGGSASGGSSSNGGGASSGGGSSSNGGGSASGGGSGASGGGDSPDASCATVTSTASLEKKAVDIIFVIDNSPSMTAEIIGVERNINGNFTAIIQDAGVDYRVIMLAKHGSATGQQSICVTAPLSGNATCTPPPATPTNGARFFHYDREISSTDSLTRIIDAHRRPDVNGFTDAGISQWLRPTALKAFVEITDDQASGSNGANGPMNAANTFENQLFALQPAVFGTATARNYVFHAITGIAAKPTASDAYLPSEPVQGMKCPEGVNSGSTYQELAIRTGGLRFPVCTPDLFDVVFREVAKGVVSAAQLACDFAIPPPPTGFTLSNKIIVEYTPQGMATQAFNQVNDPAMCNAQSYYRANNRVVLCPQACTAVRANPNGGIAVKFTCEQQGGIN